MATRGRPSGEKTRNTGRWTEARFKSFIKGGLRSMTRKWGPINDALKEARVERGKYLCNGCKKAVPATATEGRRRVKNVHVDHIEPVVCPANGWVDWDTCIERMFCEVDNLQVLCKACHDVKCQEEKDLRKQSKTSEEE